jgi:hypothetical protein
MPKALTVGGQPGFALALAGEPGVRALGANNFMVAHWYAGLEQQPIFTDVIS